MGYLVRKVFISSLHLLSLCCHRLQASSLCIHNTCVWCLCGQYLVVLGPEPWWRTGFRLGQLVMPHFTESALSEVKVPSFPACSVAAELLDPREAAEHSSPACSVQARAELPQADTLVRVVVTSKCSTPLDMELQVISALC